MFGLFKKKQEYPMRAVLSGGNSDYANFVRGAFDGFDNATLAHVLVAYKNLIPIVGGRTILLSNRGHFFN